MDIKIYVPDPHIIRWMNDHQRGYEGHRDEGQDFPGAGGQAKKLESVSNALVRHPDIEGVSVNIGGPTEFDPRKGEIVVPAGVEFVLKNNTYGALRKISDVCKEYGMRVIVPAHKQPRFSYEDHRGEERVYNTDVDFEAFIRLVEDVER